MGRGNSLFSAGVVAMTCVTSLSAFGFQPEVVYGTDDRKDLHEEGNDSMMVELARSTAALVNRRKVSELSDQPDFLRLKATAHGKSHKLCSSQPFWEQPTPAFCSGFLVGATTLVTAGHCITNEARCASTQIIFGFGYEAADKDVTLVPREDTYSCKRLIARGFDSGRGTDFAVIELDRPVVGREPLRFRKSGRIDEGTQLTAIGHPSGLPTKITSGGHVRENVAKTYFVTDLDTFGGNSGSAVFNSVTGEIEGILVRGENDYVSKGGCRVVNTCLDGTCRGEDVTRATEFAPHVPENPRAQAALTNGFF